MKQEHILVPVQYLRALGTFFVVFCHLVEMLKKFTGYEAGFLVNFIYTLGGAGVDIFFVISGFMMVYIAGNDEPCWHAAQKFLVRRVLRIVPPYWMYTLIYAGILFLFDPQVWQPGQEGWRRLYESLSFTRFQGFPVLEVGWTLMYEIYFYILFALAFWILPRRLRSGILFVLLFTAGVYGMLFPSLIPGTVFIRGNPVLAFIKNPVVFDFAYGVAAGELFLSGFLMGRTGVRLCAAVAIISLIMSAWWGNVGQLLHWRPLIWGPTSLCLVLAAVYWSPSHDARIFRKFGDISYSLYLSHPFIFVLLLGLLVPNGVDASKTVLLACILLTTVVIVSLFSYRFVEQAFGRWLRKRLGY